MGTPDGLSFLQSVAGYTQNLAKQTNPSANAPMRLAVIDPSYVASSYPVTLPRVTFEGEETLDDRRYVVIDRGYKPGPSDRVVMLPVGHTYVIVGVVTPAEVNPITDLQDAAATVSTSNTSFVSLTGGPTASINLRAGQKARITVMCQMKVSTGVTGAIMSWRSTGASGTVEATDADGNETGSDVEWVPQTRVGLYVASNGGSHSFESRYRVIGTATGDFKNRRILAEAL